eukprot:3588138-Amphidinium_carterae.1
MDNEDSVVLYEEMEGILQEMIWPAAQRQKLKGQGVRSLVYGAYTKQGSGVTMRTSQDRKLLKVLHQLIRKNQRIGEYTSVVVNRAEPGEQVAVHRDKSNLPGTLIWTTSFGSFAGVGGQLWKFDTRGTVPPPAEVQDLMPAGAKVYTARSLHRLCHDDWVTLLTCGFPVRRLHSMHTTVKVSRLQAERAILMAIAGEGHEKLTAGEHVDEEDPWLAWPELYKDVYDNITGQPLPADLVAPARREEMRFLHDLDAYEVVPIEQCYAAMGGAPIPTGWVDVNKGDTTAPKIRSRLVVKETRRNSPLQDAAAIFSSTPPFESLRLLASLAMTRRQDGSRPVKTLLFIDITRAHPHCHVQRELYIALPREDPASADGKSCGRLKRCLYGTRDAGRSFELFVYEVMTERLGFKGGV